VSDFLHCTDLHLAFGDKRVLDGIDLEIGSDQAIALVGPSGAGKSTLLRTLLGLQGVDRGEILINGRPIRSLSGRERAAELAWLPQMGTVPEPIRVLDLIAASRFRFDEGRRASEQAVLQALASCGIERLAEQPYTTLSGGEMQRVSLAGLLAQDARCFLLDEPSNHLDVRRQRELYAMLGEQLQRGRGLVMITHDINLLTALGPTSVSGQVAIVGMRDGRIDWQLAYDSDELPEALATLFEIPMQAVTVAGQRMIVPATGVDEAPP
jgi:iron complex transport system ATP-binding protein